MTGLCLLPKTLKKTLLREPFLCHTVCGTAAVFSDGGGLPCTERSRTATYGAIARQLEKRSGRLS